jgi:hypothetical protein
VQRAIFELYRNDSSPDMWKRDGTRYAMELDGVPVSVEIRDESAKIDINTATEPLLRGLLVSSGLPTTRQHGFSMPFSTGAIPMTSSAERRRRTPIQGRRPVL